MRTHLGEGTYAAISRYDITHLVLTTETTPPGGEPWVTNRIVLDDDAMLALVAFFVQEGSAEALARLEKMVNDRLPVRLTQTRVMLAELEKPSETPPAG